MYIYISSSFAIRFCRNMRQNRCHDRLQRERCCALQRNLCKVSSLKLRPNAVCFTTHKNEWEIFSVLPIAFPLLMWRFRVDALFDVVHSAMGDRKVPRTEEASAALHMLGIPRWSYNTQKLFCRMLFPEMLVCFFLLLLTRFVFWELAFSFLLQHGDLKWMKTDVVSPGSYA